VLERVAFPIDGDDVAGKLTLQGAADGGDDVVHVVSFQEESSEVLPMGCIISTL